MYQRIIKPLLFWLTIEQAHRLALLLLRSVGLIPGGRWALRKCFAEEAPSLEREVFGIRFPNPVGLAAGFDRNGEAIRELTSLGFGFIEIGTVTPRPQAGNPRPRVFRLPKDRAIVNRIGLSNHGLDATIRHLQHRRGGGIVGCNIGKNTDTLPENAAADYLKAFRSLYQYADYFTVNICCDNSCREAASHSPEQILQILEPLFDFRRGQSEYRPIMLKISPDLSDGEIDRITDMMTSSPLDGIVATNGTHLREGLRTSPAAIEAIGSGRLSGAPLTKRAVEIVRRIHTRSGGTYPIIGAGGMMGPEDVRAMLDAGADLVQLYTGFIYEGPGIVRRICRALTDAPLRHPLPTEETADPEAPAGEAPKAPTTDDPERPTATDEVRSPESSDPKTTLHP